MLKYNKQINGWVILEFRRMLPSHIEPYAMGWLGVTKLIPESLPFVVKRNLKSCIQLTSFYPGVENIWPTGAETQVQYRVCCARIVTYN